MISKKEFTEQVEHLLRGGKGWCNGCNRQGL